TVPNWTGHALMALMLQFLPSGSIEKILAVTLAFALSYSFRRLVKKGANGNGIILSYFIFPFTYSLTFLLGFYNYTIGIIILFYGITYWLNSRNEIIGNWQKWIVLAIITMLLYFSHIIPFLVFYLLIGCYEAAYLYYNKDSIKAFFKRMIVLLLSSVLS